MSWRLVLAVVVAFAIGGVLGTLVERERVKDDKTASATTTTSTTSATIPAADWFGSNSTEACPALKQWQTSATAAYTALAKAGSWDANRAEVRQEIDAAKTAYGSLESLANAEGKAGLQRLIDQQDRLSSAAPSAATPAEYLQEQRTLTTPQVHSDVAAIAAAMTVCT
jgi:hypothetical protein